EVVRQAVVEDGVLGVEPLAIQGVAVTQRLAQRGGVRRRPPLEQVEVFLAVAADQEVAAALQEQLAARTEAQAGVGAVELLLDDEVPAADLGKRGAVEALVARLEARALQVGGARVLADGGHGAAPAL